MKMKAPRFMKEYANFQKRAYQANEMMQERIRDSAIEAIEQAVKHYELGMITIDEAMEKIRRPISTYYSML